MGVPVLEQEPVEMSRRAVGRDIWCSCGVRSSHTGLPDHHLPTTAILSCGSISVVGDHGDLEGLQVAVEVEGVVAALAADAGDADAAERRREVADEERVDPHDPAAHGPADPLGPLLRRRVDDRREPVAVELASSTASSSDENVCSVSTGPKTSCCTTSLSFDAGSISVGSTCNVSPTR